MTGSITNVQFEAGAFATSYIPTTSAAVTRAADLPNITGLTFPSAYTVFAVGSPPLVGTSSNPLVVVNNGTTANRIQIEALNGTTTDSAVLVGGSQTATMNSGAPTAPTKAAVSLQAGAQLFSVNGAAPVSGSAAALPTVSQLNLGNYPTLNNRLNGFLKRAVVYPSAYTSAQLQALTQ